MTDPKELLDVFLSESLESLESTDRDLVALETDPSNHERLNAVFRTFHTIKGSAGLLGFATLEALTHTAETLLTRIREGTLTLDAHVISALLRTADAVRRVLRAIEDTGTDSDATPALGELLSLLTALADGTGGSAAASPAEPFRPELAAGESRIRVNVRLLDQLMNLVSELVLARNQVFRLATARDDPDLVATVQRLHLITTELQEVVMRTRLQPISTVWGRFPRLVRDLARACGKQVRVTMEGEDTELDKALIEAIRDPLTHLVRNAVDHGIEAPEIRARAGKSPEGRLVLRAFHRAGVVSIEISDDGAGIDLQRVREHAVQHGLLREEQAATASENELLGLIFTPGFSTAGSVTNVSGRGVGMDVVKTSMEKLGGSVEVRSRPGTGTTVLLKIPLTLAIIPAILVAANGQRYALPQVSVAELMRIEGERKRTALQWLHDTPVYPSRGKLLPLVSLRHVLGAAEPWHALLQTEDEQSIDVVVLDLGDRQFGLVVDWILDTEEVVVKPLGKQLHGIPVYAGATVLGDGGVALILDVLGVAQRARVVSESQEHRATDRKGHAHPHHARQMRLLLVQGPDNGRMAIPLDQVARLEQIEPAAVERVGGQHVVQYRGEILPLISVAKVLPERRHSPRHPAAEEGAPRGGENQPLQVVVHPLEHRNVGIVVDRILDILDADVDSFQPASRPGVQACLVVRDRVTELLDLRWIVRRAGLPLPDERSANPGAR